MEQAITVKQPKAVEAWGSRDEVREINQRLAMMMLPGGRKLSPPESLALAQAAVMHNLDPFNGEIWMIPNSGVMIGVKGLRKTARQQINGNFWTEYRMIDNAEERAALKIPDQALAYECKLFDTETINNYVESVKKFSEAKMPWELIVEILGKKPYTPGIGVLKNGESTKMTPVQCAMKRAEADALKRRFDVPFGFQTETENEPEYAGEWTPEVFNPASETVDQLPDEQKEYTIAAFYADAKAWGFSKAQADEFMNEAGALPDLAKSLAEKKFHADRLSKGKKQLGRDDTGIN